MQHGLDLLHSNYMKERSKREKGHRLQSRRFQQGSVRVHSDGFLQIPSYSTLQYAYTTLSSLPLKLPGVNGAKTGIPRDR